MLRYKAGHDTLRVIIDMMVGADEEMSVTVVRWKLGEEQLKKDMEKDEEEKREVIEGVRELKKEMNDMKADMEEESEKKKPDITFLLLERCIDTILFEEVTKVGLKINKYNALLAKTILEFAEEHQEERANLDRLSFSAQSRDPSLHSLNITELYIS